MKLAFTIIPKTGPSVEISRRLVESGLDVEQSLHAFKILQRRDIIITWNNPHQPGRKYFAAIPSKPSKHKKP